MPASRGLWRRIALCRSGRRHWHPVSAQTDDPVSGYAFSGDTIFVLPPQSTQNPDMVVNGRILTV